LNRKKEWAGVNVGMTRVVIWYSIKSLTFSETAGVEPN